MFNTLAGAVILLLSLFCVFTQAYDPFIPTAGWTIYLEAVRADPWPSCSYRFLSYPAPACNEANLWDGAGVNQEFTLISVPGAASNTFYLQASCGSYLSYPGPCDQHAVNLWPEAGINQEFTFSPTGSENPGEYFVIAQGRASCSFHYMSFPVPCSTDAPDLVDLWDAAGPEQTWRVYPLSYPQPVSQNPIADACADPFAWASPDGKKAHLSCTGGEISFHTAPNPINTTVAFSDVGSMLAGSPTSWCSSSERWAPETFVLNNDKSVMVVCDLQADGSHRTGYVFSDTGLAPNHWTEYSPNYLSLSPGPQGDIDPHIFRDPVSNNTYLIWKSDDNRIGLQTTRLWAQHIEILLNNTVVQLSDPIVIMDSTGLWWATGFNGPLSTLVEGPEMVYEDGYYYLFFAAGQYCGYTYSEGVARSTSVLGPFEKMGVPLLSSGIVGTWNGSPLRGPGHATFLRGDGGQLYAIYHAHTNDEDCERYPFIAQINFENGWPRAVINY